MKRGEVVCWVVVDAQSGELVVRTTTRQAAREHANEAGKYYVGFAGKPKECAYVAKVVLA